MEVLVYYFGQDRTGYYQYPTDYTEDFFRQNLAQARNKVQIAIHRDGNLLFYNYIRCLDELGSKIGIGFATDFILLDYQNLFETFANFYVRLVEDGAIVQLTSNGQIIIKPQPFANEKTYLDEFAKSIEEFIK